MTTAAPDSTSFAARPTPLAVLIAGAVLALGGCGTDRDARLAEQVAEANAAAARADEARKAAEAALARLQSQPPADQGDSEPTVIEGEPDGTTNDAPMDNAEPAVDPARDTAD